MHTKISSEKEHRRHRARRVSVLLVVLALLFTMLPTGLYTVADAPRRRKNRLWFLLRRRPCPNRKTP